MRKSFESNIRQYNEIAKGELAGKNEEAPEDDELQAALGWEIKKNAANRETSQAAQAEIYRLQLAKQDIFKKLKADISALDNPEMEPRLEGSKKVSFENGSYFAAEENDRTPVTLGEILTDGDWGIKYALDRSVPRETRKKYLVEAAKRDIRSLLNRQIYVDEIASQKTGPGVKGAYARKFEEEEVLGELRPGILAEKMVDGLLKKMSFSQGADFEIIESDVHLDVVKKIDFIIRRKKHYRGVDVEAESRQGKGIQFTISQNKERLAEKERQRARANAMLKPEDRLEEIVLVSVPIRHIQDVYARWKAHPAAGGPEKLWDIETKKEIFTNLLSGMLQSREIEEQWEKLKKEI